MQPVRDDALGAQPVRQADREQHVGRLALPVRHEPAVAVDVAREGGRQRLVGRPALLGRQLHAALDVVVVEAHRRQAQAEAADVDDARGAGRGRVGGAGEELRGEQVGEQEGAEVVGGELGLDALGRGAARLRDHAGVVDEDVEARDAVADVGGGAAHRGLREQVELHRQDGRRRADRVDLGGDLVEVGLRARGQDEQGRVVGGDGQGRGLAQAVAADACYQDCGTRSAF